MVLALVAGPTPYLAALFRRGAVRLLLQACRHVAPGSIFRSGVVITLRTGQETAAEPFHGWAGTYGYAGADATPMPTR